MIRANGVRFADARMSEREKSENARRLGRRAFQNGVPLESNPMRARDSRLEWEQAWRKERERDISDRAILQRQRERLGI